MKTLLTNWTVFGALVTASWAVFSFVLSSRHDLAWKRTEFIFQQSQFLDNDSEMRECTLTLYGKNPQLKVEHFLLAASSNASGSEHEGQIVIKFEKYLNFLWRIAYAHLVLGTLTRNDLDAFGAYFDAVASHTELREYCLEEGYDEIITAAEKLGA